MWLVAFQYFPTSHGSIGIRNNFLKIRTSYQKWIISFSFGKTALLIGTCAYRQKSSLRAKHDLFFYKPACMFCSSIHVLTCESLFHMVYHIALGAFWKWSSQVHVLRIPKVSENLPFAFARYLKMECLGLHNIAVQFIMGQRNVWG
jgi:hypothetical protein